MTDIDRLFLGRNKLWSFYYLKDKSGTSYKISVRILIPLITL